MSSTLKQLNVGMAELKTAAADEILVTIGLGSCVVIAIRDDKVLKGSLAHIMLPSKTAGRVRANENMNKYADVAIPKAIQHLEELGCRRNDMKAKIAGGAKMFDLGGDDQIHIGRRNVEAVTRILANCGIPLIGSDIGGKRGRTVEFSIRTGEVLVKTVKGGERWI